MNQKIPEKIREGRNNLLLMEKDKDYEYGNTVDLIDAMRNMEIKSQEIPSLNSILDSLSTI